MSSNPLEGKFKIEYLPTGVHMTLSKEIMAVKEKAKPVVEKLIAQKQIDKVDQAAIDTAFTQENTNPVIIAPPQPEPVDGKVIAQLNDLEDEVKLKIEPPMGKGKKAEMKDVMEAVKELGAENFYLDLDKIENMLTSFRYRDFVPVGEKRDGSFEIIVSKDNTEATMTLSPPFGGDPVDPDYVLSYLKNAGITTGVKKEIIEKMIRDEIYNEAIVIAVGQKPADGEDGFIEYYFDTDAGKPKPSITEEGEVDFKELNLFQTIKKGEPVAKKIPAKEGIAGMTVYGDEITPKQGKDVPMPGGLNTKPDKQDPFLVVAALDGQPKLQNNKVNVVNILEIPGDVDYSTGNINFTGSVFIRGNVISGFSVKAMGDIQVGGCIEMATIECGGNLVVSQGIVGQEKALIMSRGNVTAKFIDKATVFADGDVFVDESIMYSKVSSSGKVVLSGKKGYIMGGITRATKSIKCNQTGTQTQNMTILEVGGSPTLRDEMEKLEQEIKEAEKRAEMQSKSLQSAEKKKQKSGSDLSEDQQERVMLMSRERFALLSKLRTFKEKKEDLEEKLVRLRSSGLKVHVKSQVLPGTKICIKNAQWLAKDPLDFATFREHDGEIQYGPYEG